MIKVLRKPITINGSKHLKTFVFESGEKKMKTFNFYFTGKHEGFQVF
jgi:hypothetical protein